ncbi:hypothetical protein MHK_004040 [Candidatus Magnetomorum sp. HK-1]|nr:hypothetical protein MHK_004040 [Candidatus Magnetomorum sp. HK-1]
MKNFYTILIAFIAVFYIGCSEDETNPSPIFFGKSTINSPHGSIPKGSKAYFINNEYYLTEISPYYQGNVAIYKTKDNNIYKQFDVLDGKNYIKGLAFNYDSSNILFSVMYHKGNNPGIKIYSLDDSDAVGFVNISKYYHYMEFKSNDYMYVSVDGHNIEILEIEYYDHDTIKEVWNLDGDFELDTINIGIIEDECYNNSPWGINSWGIEGSNFSVEYNNSIEKSKFSLNNGQAYLYGNDIRDVWSLVKYTQGSVWGESTHCGVITWNRPVPLSTYGKNLFVEIDIKRELNKLLNDKAWIMLAVNLWFSSIELPTGIDLSLHKPLVFDLILYHILAALNFKWDSGSINNAIKTLKLYQLDFVIELKNAEGSATIDNFFVREKLTI